LLNRIAAHYELTVYSEVPIEASWLQLPHGYTLKQVTARKMHRRLREISLVFVLIRDHLREPFHLVHAHSTYPTGLTAVILKMIFGVPAIVSLHAAEASAFPDISFGDLLHKRRAKINRWVINNATVVTALSDFQRREVLTNLKITRQILVIHRGVDLDKFYIKRLNGLHSPAIMLSVGYLNPIKDPDTLLQAFAAIQQETDCVLLVVGRDYTNGSVKRVAEQLGIAERVKFEGYVDHEHMDVLYQRADLLLHTSRYESQGMVVAEAMASGVLVVGTNVGLLSDLSGECCVTVPTKDPGALASAVLDLLRNKERMDLMRENGYRWSRHHSLDNCSREIMELYEKMIGSR
jgi:glycosyltransferase involved in cell wall biosynthesis